MGESKLRRWLAPVMVLVLVASVGGWLLTREVLPRPIRIATAAPGGLYQRVGELLAERIEARVELVTTAGSRENRDLLLAGEVDLAILQASSVSLADLALLAPLYPEVVHVVVRADSPFERIAELAGRRVVLGGAGSGMRASAERVLARYGIETEGLEERARYFTDLASDPSLEAAVVTTGIANPDLHALFAGGEHRLLAIEDARAISMLDPIFEPFVIPRGLFHEAPPVPDSDVRSVASVAVLAARADVSSLLTSTALEALYAPDMHLELPTLVPMEEAAAASPGRLHATARAYMSPYAGLSTFSALIESISGIKELVFGAGALGYLVWDAIRRSRQRQRDGWLAAQKERLDGFLERTVDLEEAQRTTSDPARLRAHLDELTEIKLAALRELTHEDLRGDRMFLIFLMQCGNLNRKIETRIAAAERRPGDGREP